MLLVIDEIGIGSLCPTPGRLIKLVRKGAHSHWNGNAFDAEKAELTRKFAYPLPVESGGGNRRPRQPGECNIVEDIVSRQPSGLAVKSTCNEFVTARVVVQEIRREANGRIRNPVKRLRSQAHLVCIPDTLRIHEFQLLVCAYLVGGK